MRYTMVFLILMLLFISSQPLFAQEFSSGTGATEPDTLDNAYPAVQPREPVQPRPSVSSRNDIMKESNAEGGAEGYSDTGANQGY